MHEETVEQLSGRFLSTSGYIMNSLIAELQVSTRKWNIFKIYQHFGDNKDIVYI